MSNPSFARIPALCALFSAFTLAAPLTALGAEGFRCETEDGTLTVDVVKMPLKRVTVNGTIYEFNARATFSTAAGRASFEGQLWDATGFDTTDGTRWDADRFQFTRDRFGHTPSLEIDFLSPLSNVPGFTHEGSLSGAEALVPGVSRYVALVCRA